MRFQRVVQEPDYTRPPRPRVHTRQPAIWRLVPINEHEMLPDEYRPHLGAWYWHKRRLDLAHSRGPNDAGLQTAAAADVLLSRAGVLKPRATDSLLVDRRKFTAGCDSAGALALYKDSARRCSTQSSHSMRKHAARLDSLGIAQRRRGAPAAAEAGRARALLPIRYDHSTYRGSMGVHQG